MTNQEWEDCNELSDLRSENKALKEQLTAMCLHCLRGDRCRIKYGFTDIYRRTCKPEKPLTFEELTHMNGYPAFEKVVSEFGIRNDLGYWRIVHVSDNASCIYLIGFGGPKRYFDDSDFKKDDIEIYRRPPEEGEKG